MNAFGNFHETWLYQLKEIMEELHKVTTPPSTQEQHNHLRHLVLKAAETYTEYYRVKGLVAVLDVLSLFSAPWATSLERALRWIGGWRPTTIFHLVYTESSVRFESHIINILSGYRTGDLGDLSAAQLRFVSEMQCETVWEENTITEEMAALQDDVYGDVQERLTRLVEIVKKADELRLRTVRRVVEMLTPQQAVEFIIAAVELMFGIHSWGVDEDNRRRANM